MRNVTVDIVKGLGILTVVLCHNWMLFHNRGELSSVVFSFHMPLFIFISGLFFRPMQAFSSLVISKADSLLKPFYVVLFAVFIMGALTKLNFQYKAELLNILYGSGGTVSWTPLWFLSHIFMVFIVAWILNTYLFSLLKQDVYKWAILLFIFYVGATHIGTFADNQFSNVLFNRDTEHVRGLPFNLDIIPVSLPIFFAGHLLSEVCLKFKPDWIVSICMLVLFVSLHYFFDETIELNGREFGNFTVCTLQIISGIYLIFTLAFCLQFIPWLSKFFQYLGSATLYLLIFHFVPQHYVTGSLQYHFPQYLYASAVVGMVVSILVSLLLWEITLRVPIFKRLMLASFSKK